MVIEWTFGHPYLVAQHSSSLARCPPARGIAPLFRNHAPLSTSNHFALNPSPKPHPPNMPFTGGCTCGAVRYELEGEPSESRSHPLVEGDALTNIAHRRALCPDWQSPTCSGWCFDSLKRA